MKKRWFPSVRIVLYTARLSATTALLSAVLLIVLAPAAALAQASLRGAAAESKKKPNTGADAERDWNNSGSDFNTASDWIQNAVPTNGDVSWFKASVANLVVNLRIPVSIAGLYFNGTGFFRLQPDKF